MPIKDDIVNVKDGILDYLDSNSEIDCKVLISLLQGKEINREDVD
jgi:hypothetical protein